MIKVRFSEITETSLPAMRVASYRAVSKTPEDDALKVLTQWLADAGVKSLGRHFGHDVEVTQTQAAAGLRGYELWMEVPNGVWPAPPVTVRDFPGGRAATLTIQRPFDDPFLYIPDGWKRMESWAIGKGLPAADLLCLEEVIGPDDARDMILYLMLP